jgi:curved DNA-binding protein CbpA
MSKADSSKDYYELLGVGEEASRVEIDRQYKRKAAKHHPDLGGNEEEMKSLNEAYGVLKDQVARKDYDARRKRPLVNTGFVPASAPTAQDIGVFGHCLSALLCLITGMFLLFLVRFQWIWFLWPLAILALFVIGFGVLMARSAMLAVNASLPVSNRFRRHTRIQEIAFWAAVFSGAYGVYLLLAQ